MSDSRVLFEFRADATNIQKTLNDIDERLVGTQGHAEKIGASFTNSGKIATQGGRMMKDASNQAMTAVTGLNWAISDMPYMFQNTRMGIMAVSNNITPLVQNISYLQKTTGSFKSALKSMLTVFTGPMGMVFAITAVIAVVQSLSFIMAKQKDKAEAAAGANKKYKDSLEAIDKSVNIDALESQITQSLLLGQATRQMIKNKEDERAAELAVLQDAQKKINVQNRYNQLIKQQSDLKILAMNAATEAERQSYENQAKSMEDEIARTRTQKELIKNNNKDLKEIISTKEKTIKEIDKEIDKAKEILLTEENTQEAINKRIELLRKTGIESKKELNYEKEKEEFRISQLSTEEQIAEWTKVKEGLQASTTDKEKGTVEYKEMILDLDKKIYALRKGIKEEGTDPDYESAKKEAEARRIAYLKIKDEHDLFIQGIDISSDEYLQRQIDRIQVEIAATEAGTKERLLLEAKLDEFRAQLIQNQLDRTKSMIDEEIEYERRLTDVIAGNGLESVYEQMFSRIKQQILQFWFDRLGITRAMMNMENAIVLIGQGKLEAAKQAYHQRDMTRMADETAAAATAAGVKGTESAAGIPFPGNIAAIGLVLASVFAALRKAKVNGSQIVAAAEGAIINKPTLLLAGEAMNRSGAEIVMPEKNFSRYMDQKILPGIMAKVNINNKGLETRMERVEKAIYSIGNQIPGETGKAVRRALKGKF